MLRSLVFVLWLYGSLGVIGLGGLPSVLMPRRYVMMVIRTYARSILFGLRHIMGTEIEVRGAGTLPSGPLIMAGKHHAMVDVFMPFLMFDDPIIVMKRELVFYPVLGWYALRAGMIAIDRAGGAKTMRQMLQIARQRVPASAESSGRQMVIFPEGTRVQLGAAPDYKPAGLRAFYKALGLPIIPIATNAGLCWPAKGVRRWPGRIVYQVLPAIPPGLSQAEMLEQVIAALETSTNALIDEGRAVQIAMQSRDMSQGPDENATHSPGTNP